VLPRGSGVMETAGMWVVSPEVMGTITTWAVKKSFALLGILHCHGGSSVRMSVTDRAHLVHAPGLLSVIVGHGGFDRQSSSWGWYVFRDGRYHRLTGMELKQCITVPTFSTCLVLEASIEGVKAVAL
jgi:hypothetical protein